MKQFLTLAILLLLTSQAFAQAEIRGQITDESGEILPGASVIVLETGQGTSADEKGLYSFKNMMPGNYTVQVSFVGYESSTRSTKIPKGIGRAILHVQLEDRIVSLNELTVSATRAGEKSPFSYTNLSKETLAQNNLGQDAPYQLRWTPSVVVTSDAGAGIGYTGIRIRGSDPTRINVTINGIPLNDAESQGVFWVNLPDFMSSTESVQIQRGVGTSTNGAGAFGGTINLNTTKVQKEAYAQIDGSAGSFNTLRANVQFGSGLLHKQFTLDGRLSRITSDGYIDRARVDLESFYLSGAWLKNRSSLRFNLFSGQEVTYQAWNGVPAQYIEDKTLRRFNVSGMEKSQKDPHDNEVDDYKQTHYQLLYSTQFNRNWNLNLAGHYTKGAGFFEQYKGAESFSSYGLPNFRFQESPCDTCPIVTIYETDLIRRRWLDNDFYGATGSLNYIRNDNRLKWTLGGAWSNYKGDHFGEIIWAARLPFGIEPEHRYYEGKGEKIDANIFSKVSLDITAFLTAFVDLQYRHVDYEVTGTDNDLRDIGLSDKLHFFNPKTGLFYNLNLSTQLYASFAVANREPNRNDYTDAPQGIQPKSERLYNTEIGYRQNFGKAALSINAYHMLYRDQLVLTGQINDVGAAIKVNVPNSYRAGIELAGNVDLTPKLSLQANATLSQNKIKSFTEFRDNWDTWEQEIIEHGDIDIAFSPNVIISGELSYDVWKGDRKNQGQELSFSLLNKYVGEQFIDNTSNKNTVLDAYFFNDFRIRYQFQTNFIKSIGLTFLVRNIFDARYSSNAWTYRYASASYDARPDDAYARSEGNDVYNLTGFYPQAGRNFLAGLSVQF